MGCVVAIVIVLLIGLFVTYPIPALFITGILIVIGVVVGINKRAENKEKERIQNESREAGKKKYLEAKSRIVIPNNSLEVQCNVGTSIHGIEVQQNAFLSMWIADNNLCLFPAYPPENEVGKIEKIQIPVKDIEYYATRGEIVHETKISGGGGGGSSIGGAVVGGVIAGGAGAVIGSRKKTDPIKSELITHDNRETFLNYFSSTNTRKTVFFAFRDYSKFNDLIPEKAYDIVSAVKNKLLINKGISENTTMTITDQIRELAKLKDEGILTEEEFSVKKKALLEKIS